MQKDKNAIQLQHILAIKDGILAVRTTEKSEFNKKVIANRPTDTRTVYPEKGRMLTQREMSILRRNLQIWPTIPSWCGIEHDAAEMRGYNVTRKHNLIKVTI